MSRKSGLGKGLGALIPSEASSVDTDAGAVALQQVPIDAIHPNQLQPREHFDEDSLESLTASIRELGVLQPILVRPVGNGFELIAGERRWRSAKRAGWWQFRPLFATSRIVFRSSTPSSRTCTAKI